MSMINPNYDPRPATAPARAPAQAKSDAAPAGDDTAAGGTKLDYGKHAVYSLALDYFPRALGAVANVSEYGSRKYAAKGWLKVPNGKVRYSDALGRHLLKEAIEGPYDDGDSGLSHAAQAAWNALARLELMLIGGSVEDRRGNDIGPDKKPVLGTARKV